MQPMTDQPADFEICAGTHSVVVDDAGITVTARGSKLMNLRLRGADGFARITLMLDHPAARGVVLRDLRSVAALARIAQPSIPIHDELDLAKAIIGVAFIAELAADEVAALRLISVNAITSAGSDG